MALDGELKSYIKRSKKDEKAEPNNNDIGLYRRVKSLSSAFVSRFNFWWKPNLSEKILLLPPQHLEQAIDQDFSKSLLAQDLIDVDNQLNQQVGEIQKLQEAEGQYIGEESIEIRHQILEGKKSYVELMGDQLDLKRAKLSTKLNYLKRLMRKVKRDGARLADTSGLRELQEQAVSRANSIDSALRMTCLRQACKKRASTASIMKRTNKRLPSYAQ